VLFEYFFTTCRLKSVVGELPQNASGRAVWAGRRRLPCVSPFVLFKWHFEFEIKKTPCFLLLWNKIRECFPYCSLFLCLLLHIIVFCYIAYWLLFLVKRPFCGAVHRRKLAFSRKHFHNAFLMKWTGRL
jgi:hypothetical protein